MLDLLESVFISLVSLLSLRVFLSAFSYEKEAYGKFSVKLLIIASTTLLSYMITHIFAQTLLVKAMAIILLYSLMGWICYHLTYVKSLALTCFFYCLMGCVDIFSALLVHRLFGSIHSLSDEEDLVAGIIITIGYLIGFPLTLLLKRILGKNNTYNIQKADWLRFLPLPSMSIVIAVGMISVILNTASRDAQFILYLAVMVLLLMNFYMFYALNEMTKRNANLHGTEILKLQSTDKQEMYQSLLDNYRKQQAKNHEYYNHLMALSCYLKDKDYVKLETYLSRIQGDYVNEQRIFDTNNIVVNTILDTKYREMVRKEIAFIFEISDLSGLPFSDEDLVIMLSNLLNNAIEACEKNKQNRAIHFKFIQDEAFILLSIRNRYEGEFSEEVNGIRTSKKDVLNHGIGLRNVQKVVERYGGNYMVNKKNNEFSVSIMFSESL